MSIVHQQLTPDVYSYTVDISNTDADAQNKPPNAEKKAKKAKKEGKQIGLLVKAIEEWELNLIKLTRSCEFMLLLSCAEAWVHVLSQCTHIYNRIC